MPITRNPRPTHAAASPQRPGQPEYVIATPLTLRAKPPRAKTPNGVENRRPHGEGRKGGKVEAKAKLAVGCCYPDGSAEESRPNFRNNLCRAVGCVAFASSRDRLVSVQRYGSPSDLHSPLSPPHHTGKASEK